MTFRVVNWFDEHHVICFVISGGRAVHVQALDDGPPLQAAVAQARRQQRVAVQPAAQKHRKRSLEGVNAGVTE